MGITADLRLATDWVEHIKSWKSGPPTSDAHLPVGAIFLDAPFGPELVVVPAGEFTIEPSGTLGRQQPHRVTIASAFAVSRFGIRRTEWDAVCSSGGITHTRALNDYKPAKRHLVHMTWKGAKDYCARLSKVTGKLYRLLSEAEWDYCCLAGVSPSFCSDNDISKVRPKDKRPSEDLISKGGTRLLRAPTDGKRALNPWGLFPTTNHMLEWCEDRFYDDFGGVPTDGSARTSGKQYERVARTGTYKIRPDILRSRCRIGVDPGLSVFALTFRVARMLSTVPDYPDVSAVSPRSLDTRGLSGGEGGSDGTQRGAVSEGAEHG